MIKQRNVGRPFKILSLDGGGAKGFYTLGVLNEVEAMLGERLCECFDLVYGTSTGSIIAAMIVLGSSVEEIHTQYVDHVPALMRLKSASARSEKLTSLSNDIFGNSTFSATKTGIGIVSTRWMTEKPMIFKGDVGQAHGRKATFVPGFGCSLGDAVQASCSAYPFFNRKIVKTSKEDAVELVDGGYCANNPTLYALADAERAFNIARTDIRMKAVASVRNFVHAPIVSAEYAISVR